MIPFYDADGIQIYNAHVLDGLRALAARSVQAVVTSPPYFGLRAYATNSQIWEGAAPLCGDGLHEWADSSRLNPNASGGGQGHSKGKQKTNRGSYVAAYKARVIGSDTCARCGAWRGELGSEPSPELYIAHLVQIFREVKRVLRDDGLVWANLGVSYWAGKGQSAQKGGAHQEGRHARGESLNRGYQTVGGGKDVTRPADGKHPIYKSKDLVLVPHLFALAMQTEGWYLRNEIPWMKRNCMPGSQQDRLTNSHEHIFLFSKQKHYFYDVDAVRIAQQPVSVERAKYAIGLNPKTELMPDRKDNGKSMNYVNPKTIDQTRADALAGVGRQMRTKDFFDVGLDALIEQQRAYLEHLEGVRTDGGVLFSPDGNVDAFVVTTNAYKGAHFACFPLKLVRPMLQLSTSAGGCCAYCQKPFRRVVREHKEKVWAETARENKKIARAQGGYSPSSVFLTGVRTVRETEGWRAACGCAEDSAAQGKEARSVTRAGANTGAHNKVPYKNNNPHRMCLYASKYRDGGYGQTTNGFQRTHRIEAEREASRAAAAELYPDDARAQQEYVNWVHDHGGLAARETVGWERECECAGEVARETRESEAMPCVVMDIFHGAGTTMLAARELGLRYIGLELNAEYVKLSIKRLAEGKERLEREKEKRAVKRAASEPAKGISRSNGHDIETAQMAFWV